MITKLPVSATTLAFGTQSQDERRRMNDKQVHTELLSIILSRVVQTSPHTRLRSTCTRHSTFFAVEQESSPIPAGDGIAFVAARGLGNITVMCLTCIGLDSLDFGWRVSYSPFPIQGNVICIIFLRDMATISGSAREMINKERGGDTSLP